MAADDYAVVVGITKYPGFEDLKGPENDAVSFREWLLSDDGGGLPERQVFLVVSSAYQEEGDPLQAKPQTGQVDPVFDHLIERGMERGGRLGRRLYIFLAGHGFGPDIEDAALFMANAAPLRLGYHIPGRRYARWFQTAAMFEEVVLFMDCCRDDYMNAPVRTPPWPRIHNAAGANVRTFYGFATKWSRKARERPVSEGGPVKGLFTRALLTALEKSPPDEEGRVTGAAIEKYVHNYLPKLIEDDEYQEPRFDYDKYHDIVFACRDAPATVPVRITFANPDETRSVEVLDLRFDPVKPATPMMGSWEHTLEPGRYMVREPGADRRKAFDVIGEGVVNVSF